MYLSRIKNPTLILNRDIAVSNINRMASRCSKSGIRFRPHFKTHQSHRVASWFRDEGATEITVSSSLMASYFIDDGWNDLTIAFPYNPREHDLLESMAGKARICLTVTGPESASVLSGNARSNFDVMLKIDTGYGRSGLLWTEVDEAIKSADILATNRSLHFKGLISHTGNTYGVGNHEEVISIYNEATRRMNYLREKTGLEKAIVSMGDTPSASVVKEVGRVDEWRPGNFVFYDLMQYSHGICSFNEIAVAMACPVVDTRPKNGTIVIHGGAVHMSKESVMIDNKKVFGMMVMITPEGWIPFEEPYYLTSLSQEHGIISLPTAVARKFKPGDLVGIIPVHSCLTANLAGGYILTDGSGADHMNERKYSLGDPIS